MSVLSLADRLERNRAAAEAAFVDLEREINAARNEITERAVRALAKADPHMTLDVTLDRLARIWCDAMMPSVRR